MMPHSNTIQLPQSPSEVKSIAPRSNVTFCKYLEYLNWKPGKTKYHQTYAAFLRAASLGIDAQVATDEIVRRIESSGGVLLPDQVARQQQRAYAFVGDNQKLGVVGKIPAAPKPVFSPAILHRVAERVKIPDIIGMVKGRSSFEPSMVRGGFFLNQLYNRNEKIVVFTVFKSQGQALFEIGRAGQIVPQGGPDGVWFLCNPVDGRQHPNPRNGSKLSRRSEESVTSWRYLVIESDEADAGDWLRAVVQMPLRIVAIYTSGGRSIHCLIRLDAATKAEWDLKKQMLKPALVTLGADEGAMTAVRLTRLPNCWRGTELQELFYLNPAADGTPIMELPERLLTIPVPPPKNFTTIGGVVHG